ncbi:flagellar export chaperone FliS [Solidesulfovibrio sp.]
MQSAVKTYIQTQISTTTQGDLVIMLFDAALKFLHQAKEKMAERNYAQKGILISKALDILSELQGSLNVNKGGELAERLQKLYFFCSSRLLTANLKMDVDKVDEVVGILTGLRGAFSEANAMVTTKAVPSSATQPPRSNPAATTLGRSHLGAGPAAMPPMPGLGRQAAAGRYAAAPVPAGPAGLRAVPPPASGVGSMPTGQSGVPAPAAKAVPPAVPTAAARIEMPTATATPAAVAAPQVPDVASPADRDEPEMTVVDTPRPAVSPVRRAMSAYAQGRTTS